MSAPWSNEREEEFVSMMEARPELFDNTEMNFTNKTAKMNAWYELSQHFLINERELKKKWDSLRTQYSRYTKLMYGSDGRFFTPRQQWIMQRLKFLDPHIKRRSNYCTELDYEVMVVENGCDDSPAQVDVEIEADSVNKPDLDAPEPSRQPPKRSYQEDDADSVHSCGTKKPCLEKTVTPIYQKTFVRRACDEDEDEGSDSASVRRMVCSSVEEKKDEHWDGFSSYVTSCVRSLDSARSRVRVQEDVCAVLQRHMDGDEDGPAEGSGACRRACAACCLSRKSRGPAEEDQDDLEPFLKSMSIIMRRLPETERSELKFKIHELVHKAQMKHLNEERNLQNSSGDADAAAPSGQSVFHMCSNSLGKALL